MPGKTVDIPTPRGVIDAYAAHPGDDKPYPLVILFMDVWGLREELFAIARRVAAEGYYCLVPNLFYREGKFRFERRNAEGRMVSFNTLPQDIQIDMRARAERLDLEAIGAQFVGYLGKDRLLPRRQLQDHRQQQPLSFDGVRTALPQDLFEQYALVRHVLIDDPQPGAVHRQDERIAYLPQWLQRRQ